MVLLEIIELIETCWLLIPSEDTFWEDICLNFSLHIWSCSVFILVVPGQYLTMTLYFF